MEGLDENAGTAATDSVAGPTLIGVFPASAKDMMVDEMEEDTGPNVTEETLHDTCMLAETANGTVKETVRTPATMVAALAETDVALYTHDVTPLTSVNPVRLLAVMVLMEVLPDGTTLTVTAAV